MFNVFLGELMGHDVLLDVLRLARAAHVPGVDLGVRAERVNDPLGDLPSLFLASGLVFLWVVLYLLNPKSQARRLLQLLRSLLREACALEGYLGRCLLREAGSKGWVLLEKPQHVETTVHCF